MLESPLPPAASPWRAGWDAARANTLPAAVIATVGVLILLGYYRHEPTHAVLEQLAAIKTRWGLLFSLVSTAVFGGLLPVLVQQVVPGLVHRERLRHLPFFLVFWGLKGMETDLFYRLQAWVWGPQVTPGTVAVKLAVDMVVFAPLYAVPCIVLAYAWKDLGFDAGRLRARVLPLGPWYRRQVVPVLIANHAIWIPAVAVLYSLPLALQMPFQNLVQCLSILIATFVMASHRRTETAPAGGITSS